MHKGKWNTLFLCDIATRPPEINSIRRRRSPTALQGVAKRKTFGCVPSDAVRRRAPPATRCTSVRGRSHMNVRDKDTRPPWQLHRGIVLSRCAPTARQGQSSLAQPPPARRSSVRSPGPKRNATSSLPCSLAQRRSLVWYFH